MERDEFFDRSRAWSKRKLRLLSKYLLPFAAKLGSRYPTVYCIDGFAGVGKYGFDEDGSPLIMAKAADSSASWRNPVALRIISVESNEIHYRELCENTRPWKEKGIVENILGEFSNLIQLIVTRIGPAPALFFIDPYGPSKIPFSSLLPILTRPQFTSELLINFDTDGLRRIADSVYADNSDKGRDAKRRLVGDVLGTDKWEDFFKSKRYPTKDREDFLLNLYMNQLVTHKYKVVSYEIRAMESQWPKYHMVFCTRHEDGILLMNNFIREEEDNVIRDTSYKSHTPSLFDEVDKDQQDRMTSLRQIVTSELAKLGKTTRGEVKRTLIDRHFGKFHQKEYNHVFKELIETGKIEAKHGKNRINDRELLQYIP